MTRVKIDPGACGMVSIAEVKKKKGKKFSVSIHSDCEMVEKLAADISELNFMDVFKRICDNPVYQKGSLCLKHVSCPVPCAVLKALEVEAGLAVPKDVSIRFHNKKK